MFNSNQTGLRATWKLHILSLLCLAGCFDLTGHENWHPPQHPGKHQELAYVTIASTHEVLAIDPKSRSIVDRYPVGEGPAIIVASPATAKLYTANWGDNTVSAVHPNTGTVSNIPVDGRPYIIAISPSGSYLYIGTFPTGISVLDTHTDQVVARFATNELAASLIVSPDGQTLYVATIDFAGGPGTLRAIATEDGSTVHTPIPVGVAPGWITISHDGAEVYTLNFRSDDVTVVSTSPFQVAATIDTGVGSQGIIGNMSPDDETLYVTNFGTGTLIGIDRFQRAITRTIELDARPAGVQFDSKGEQVFVTDYGSGSLTRPSDDTFLNTGVFVGSSPGRLRSFDMERGTETGLAITTPPGPTSVVTLRHQTH